ncbi:hypothetical protein EPN83_03500 [Patescibacteria group bacterium]|nr:MAG: hypothetical protein EPN83_03500 [Patescibacteria group bacterium]
MPSKKIILIFILAAALVGAIFYFSQNQKPAIYSQTKPSSSQNLPAVSELDSDGDGLKDWEEVIWGTDPDNPDTNGNGLTDEKEIAKQKETANSALPIFERNDSTANQSENQTDEISKKLFADYLSMKQSGGINPDSIFDIAARAAGSISTPQPKKTYSLADLQIIPTGATQATLLSYANNLLSVYQNTRSKLEGASADYKQLVDPESPKFKERITQVSDAYIALAQDLQKLSVPKEIAATQVSLMNNYLQTSAEFKNLLLIKSDPLPGLTSIRKIKENSAEESSLLKTLENYLATRGIIFSESGGVFITKSQ